MVLVLQSPPVTLEIKCKPSVQFHTPTPSKWTIYLCTPLERLGSHDLMWVSLVHSNWSEIISSTCNTEAVDTAHGQTID